MRPEANPEQRVKKARTQLLMDAPFFGLLSMRLRLKEDPACSNIWTDAQTLGFNPRYVLSLTDLELRAVLAKLLSHIAAGHPWRQGRRENVRWQKAISYAINPILSSAGYRLPKGFLVSEEFTGKPAELIYEELPLESPPEAGSSAKTDGSSEEGGEGESQAQEQGDEGADSESTSANDAPASEPEMSSPKESPTVGEVRPAPEGVSEQEWMTAVVEAETRQGQLPGGLDIVAKNARSASVDWRDALRAFVQQSLRASDYSMTRPNRKFLHLGLYLPGLAGESVPCLAAIRDTSGSTMGPYQDAFNSEMLDIFLSVSPERAIVLDCDAAVQQVHYFDASEGFPDCLNAKGGGGTSFIPAFKWLEAEREEPVCAIYFTDLAGTFPSEPPPYPVIWAVPEGHCANKPPFGEVVAISRIY